MVPLPKVRVTPEEPPFSRGGVDYFSPMEVKQGHSHVKRYRCLFISLKVQALQVEVVHSLNTDSMINALCRFVSVHGCSLEIWGDNR